MKKIFIILLLISGFSSVTYSQFAYSFKNSKYNYSINIPKSYDIKKYPSENDPDTVVAINSDGSEFSITAGYDKVYKGVNGSQLPPNSFMPALKYKYKQVELIENDYTDLGGEPCMFMKVKYKNEDEEGIVSQFVLVRSERLFIIRVKAVKDLYEKFEAELTGYIFTFQFMESAQKEFYKNEMYSFIINFPPGWQFDRNEFPVQANSPKGSSMYIETIKSTEYADMTAFDLDTDMLLEALNTKFSNITIAAKKKLNIDGNPVLYVKYRWVQAQTGKGDSYYIIHYYLIKKTVLFVFQGMVRDKDTKDEEKLIQESVESFQFTK
ncbi:MAG: hypothetical protein PHN88_05110 [Ignavibacteria bacterium]|nr:hypothetical protein [Ignavibacteria bacterium]